MVCDEWEKKKGKIKQTKMKTHSAEMHEVNGTASRSGWSRRSPAPSPAARSAARGPRRQAPLSFPISFAALTSHVSECPKPE